VHSVVFSLTANWADTQYIDIYRGSTREGIMRERFYAYVIWALCLLPTAARAELNWLFEYRDVQANVHFIPTGGGTPTDVNQQSTSAGTFEHWVATQTNNYSTLGGSPNCIASQDSQFTVSGGFNHFLANGSFGSNPRTTVGGTYQPWGESMALLNRSAQRIGNTFVARQRLYFTDLVPLVGNIAAWHLDILVRRQHATGRYVRHQQSLRHQLCGGPRACWDWIPCSWITFAAAPAAITSHAFRSCAQSPCHQPPAGRSLAPARH
jgi:hypothetical protein